MSRFEVHLADDAATEGDHAAAAVEDGEHQPFAEAVVFVAALVAGHHARFGEQLQPSFVVAQGLDHAIEAGRRPAEAKACDGLRVQSALAAIGLRLGAFRQLLLIPARAGIEQGVKVGDRRAHV